MTTRDQDTSELHEMSAGIDLQAAAYEGFIDAVEDGRIFGWALDPEEPENRLEIDIFHGTKKIGHAVANRYREDLVVYGNGSGKHAFVFTLPKKLWGEDPGGFYACFSGTEIPLLRGPRCSELRPVGEAAGREEQTDAEGSGKDISAVLGRIESCERALVTMVHLVHPGSDYEKSKSARSEELRGLITQVREELVSLEAFIVRHDERLKKVEATLERLDDPQALRWFEKTQRIGLVAGIFTLLAFGVLYLINVWN